MKKTCFLCVLITILLITVRAEAHYKDWEDLVDVSSLSRQIGQLHESARVLLEASEYDVIEAMADKYRNDKGIYADGLWELAEFYDGLSFRLITTLNEYDFTRRLRLLNNWAAAKPDSITARVALADFMVSYAFFGRGYGPASTVSEARWQTFITRLKSAEDALLQAKSLKQKCPGWWAAYMRIAAVAWEDHSRYEQLFKDAVAFEPKYYTFYYYRAWDLMPRWSGAEGELEQFAKTTADRLSGEEGDMLYAGIILYMDTRGPYNNKKNRNPRISWDRVARGVSLLKQHSIKYASQSNPVQPATGS